MKTVMIDCSSHRDECDQHGLSRTEARVYVSTEGAAVYPPSGSEWSTVYNLQAVAEAALDTLPRLEAITPSEYIERASHLADSMVGNVDERVIFVLLQDPGDAETLKVGWLGCACAWLLVVLQWGAPRCNRSSVHIQCVCAHMCWCRLHLDANLGAILS